MSLRKTIARNTMYNAAGRLWDALSTLVLTRYIFDCVGQEGYGLWGIAFLFISYVALLDLGIGSSYVKYISEHAARDERDALSAVASTGFFLYSALGVLLVAIGWPLMHYVAALFQHFGKLDAARTSEALFLFRGALLLFVAGNVIAPLAAIPTGLQRMGLTNLVSFVSSLVKIAATVFFLQAGYGLRGLLCANALAFAAYALGSAWLAFRLAPGLRLGLRHVERATFQRLFAFGWRAQVSRLSNVIMFETDMLIAFFLSGALGLAGLYKLGVDLASKMRQVPTLLVSALLPAASQLDARRDEEALARMYLISTKYLAAITMPLVLFTVGCASLLMRAWMGPGHEVSAWVLRIIAFGYVANILPGAGVSVVLGKGRAGLQMIAGVIATVSNIVLTIGLVLVIGFWGIPIGTAVSMFLSWAWFAWALKPELGVGPSQLLRVAAMWPTLASLPGFIGCASLDIWTRSMPEAAGFIPSMGLLIAATVVYWPLYLLLVRMTPFLDAFDYAFLDETLGLGRVPVLGAWLRRMRHA